MSLFFLYLYASICFSRPCHPDSFGEGQFNHLNLHCWL
jgi:hypothetical protein